MLQKSIFYFLTWGNKISSWPLGKEENAVQESSASTKTSSFARATSVLGAMALYTFFVQQKMPKQISACASSAHLKQQQSDLLPNQQRRRHVKLVGEQIMKENLLTCTSIILQKKHHHQHLSQVTKGESMERKKWWWEKWGRRQDHKQTKFCSNETQR